MITLTDTAATKVKDLIEAEGEPNLALRVAVRPGGCSGFSYEMFFDTDVAADDNLVDYSGVRVVVAEATTREDGLVDAAPAAPVVVVERTAS